MPISRATTELQHQARERGELGEPLAHDPAHQMGDDELEHRMRELREATRQAQELAQQARAASAAKSQFLAHISHEVRTPMNGVLGMASLLLQTDLTPKQRHLAESLLRSGETLMDLLNEILDFSKIEAGVLKIDHAEFALRAPVDEAIQLFAERARAKGLTLTGSFADGVPELVRGDPGRLRQVLCNLVSNAIKFTSTGSVEIQVRPDRTRQSECIAFAVRDTGIGICSQDQQRIFEPFTQADSSSTRCFGGTGLGLTISKHIVERLGGALTVESHPDRGATFSFTLPLPAVIRTPALELPAARAAALRVLVVDTNPKETSSLADLLRTWKIPTEVVHSVAEALTQIGLLSNTGGRFSMAIVDPATGIAEGLAVAAQLRAQSTPHRLRVVLLTADVQGQLTAEMQAAGIVACLAKPLRRAVLFDCLHSAGERPSAAGVRPSQPTALELQQQPPLRLLLAEDNPVNQEVTDSMLRALGCNVDLVSDGEQAVRAAATRYYDAILMDWHMPRMDGLAATQAIRHFESGCDEAETPCTSPDVPIIALTASATPADREACLGSGMSDYLSKPFTMAQMSTLVSKLRAARSNTTGRSGVTGTSTSQTASASTQHTPAASRTTGSLASAALSASLDSKAFRALQGLGQQTSARLCRIIEMFFSEAERLVAALEQAAAASDHAALRRHAHRLKSSSALVGATKLSRLCKELELGALDAPAENLEQRVTELRAEYVAVTTVLHQELERASCSSSIAP